MDYVIELNTFIKLIGIVNSGGMAKRIIRSGVVYVNGVVETRNKKKLYINDVVTVDGRDYIVGEVLNGKR
jgi:ribosome-associated protein